MNYTVKQLCDLSGVSARTLRYYDKIGLLCPKRNANNEYRMYDESDVDALQQILIYREMGLTLSDIDRIIHDAGVDRAAVLSSHLYLLQQQKERIERLIETVGKTVCAMKGEIDLSNEEKFAGIKTAYIAENEQKFGAESREKYGERAVEASNEKILAMNREEWAYKDALEARMLLLLQQALTKGDCCCAEAAEACELHKKWLCMFWSHGSYSADAHRALADSYVADDRFKAYYDGKLGHGGAKFLRNAIYAFAK